MNKVMKAKIYAAKADMSQAEWVESRKKGIGGSDAAAIAGLNPYKSAYTVYADKLGLLPEQPDNERMRQGRDLEEYVVRRFREDMEEKGTPKKTKNCNYILQHPQYPWMLANVDRLIVGEDAGLECKTTSVLNLRRFNGEDFPEEYYVQCMHYMAVTGAARWYLGVLILNQGYQTYTIERDEQEIESLIRLEERFWNENVLKQQEPAPDGSDRTGEAILSLYPSADESEIDLSLYDDDIERYMALSAEIKDRKRKQQEIKQRIQAYMKDAGRGRACGYAVKWANVESARLDSEALCAENPEVYRQYLRPTVTRRFSITEIQ